MLMLSDELAGLFLNITCKFEKGHFCAWSPRTWFQSSDCDPPMRLGGGGVTCKFEKQPHAKRPPVVDDQVLLSDALCKSFHGAN